MTSAPPFEPGLRTGSVKVATPLSMPADAHVANRRELPSVLPTPDPWWIQMLLGRRKR